MINLVRDDENAEPGVYEFTFKHNAFGEVASSGDGNYVMGGTYVSFPAAGMLVEDEADIIIHWNSVEDEEGSQKAEGKRNSLVYHWKKGGFEQDLGI